MLERAVGCLETSGRHLLRASRKSVKSRRMLHSTFWAHGAGDLDLPPWCTSIIQGALGDVLESGSNRDLLNRNIYPNSFAEIGLDFLYPAKTLAFIQRCSAYGPEKWQCHRGRQSAKQSTRTYASVAGEALENNELDSKPPHAQVKDLTESTNVELALSDNIDHRRVLQNRLESATVRDSEDIWQLYRRMGTTQIDGSMLVNILRVLASSYRKVDAGRSAKVFESIPLLDRTASVYRNGVESYIKLDDLERAYQIHQEALPKTLAQGSIASGLLLARMIDAQNWPAAYDLWNACNENKPTYSSRPDLWDAVRDLSHIKKRALSLATYASKVKQTDESRTGTPQEEGLLKFLSKVIKIAISFNNAIDGMETIKLFKRLARLNLLTAEHYEKAIIPLLSLGSSDSLRQAHKLYGWFRKALHLNPSRPLLRATLKSYCEAHNFTGMRNVMDDWFRVYDGPDRTSYRMLLRSFARQGNLATVQKLSDAYSERFKGDMKHLPLLLYVHARRGLLEETVKQFKEISAAAISDELYLKCWNILLYAYTRADNVDGALQCFNALLFHGLKPDDYTFGTLMGVCANRGDAESVDDLLRLSDSYGIKRSIAMIDCVVLAHIKSDSLEDAERLVEAAMEMDLEGPRTRMWNYVLTAHAFQRDIESVTRIHQRMKELGVAEDGMTYAALMQLLAVLKQANAAEKLLHITHFNDRTKLTSFHYAIVMGGYLATGELKGLFQVYQLMKSAGIKPDASSQSFLLRGSVSVDVERIAEHGSQEEQLTVAETILEQTLKGASLMEAAVKTPMRGLSIQSINDRYPAMYFDYQIYVYGQLRAFNKVRELYANYVETVKKLRPDQNVAPPVNFLCALMVSHLREEKWSDLEKCWNLAREQMTEAAKPLAMAATASSKPYQALYHRRFVLCPPLLYYIKALDEQGKFDEMRSTIESLQQDGFALDNKVWNAYIQILARSYHHLEAFELCEQQLMPGWPGWPAVAERRRVRKKEIKNLRTDRLLTGRLFPIYRTMVYLAGALLDIRSMGLGDEGMTLMAKIRKSAPRTLDAVRGLPRIDDKVQQDILRS